MREASAHLPLTFDKDFGELVYRQGRGASSGVVLLRAVLATPEEMADFVVRLLASRKDWTDRFSVVERDRVRVRDLRRQAPTERR